MSLPKTRQPRSPQKISFDSCVAASIVPISKPSVRSGRVAFHVIISICTLRSIPAP